jgi:hypothetical protein
MDLFALPLSIEDRIAIAIYQRLAAKAELVALFGAGGIVRRSVFHPSAIDAKPSLVVATTLLTEDHALSMRVVGVASVGVMVEFEAPFAELGPLEPSVSSLLSLIRTTVETGPPVGTGMSVGQLPDPLLSTRALNDNAHPVKWEAISQLPNNYGGQPTLFYIGQKCNVTYRADVHTRNQ